MRIDQLHKVFDLETKWVAFPLHPDIPEGGLALADLFKGAQIDINKVQARLKEVAADLGLPLGERSRTYNTRRAQELAKWAETRGSGEAFHRAVFRAYFVEGRDISALDQLIEITEKMKLSAEAAREALLSGAYRSAVDHDWARSRQLGITAVPTFVMGTGRITGAQPYEVLEKFVRENLE